MATLEKCDACESVTAHSSQSGCLKCLERRERAIEEEWTELDLEEKLRSLYRRVRKLETRSSLLD